MNLPRLEDLQVSGKKVILRLDLDLPAQAGIPEADDSRLESARETILYLLKKRAKIIAIGHKGEPHGVVDGKLSLAPIAERLGRILDKKVGFIYDKESSEKLGEAEIIMLENLRFDSREEANDEAFAKSLSELGEVYVNEAFATSHREHASIVGIPKLLPHAAGFRFIKEIENLNRVIENPKKPVVVIISGIKEDKVEMAKELVGKVDTVLVGGRLPIYFGDTNPNPPKMIVGDLIADKEDITPNTVTRFQKEIAGAGTIVLAGVLGKYEEEGHRQGTKEIFEAVAASSAFKVAGGGDTEAALTMFGLTGKFDWISVGGGAMLEFLVKGTLPGIKALIE